MKTGIAFLLWAVTLLVMIWHLCFSYGPNPPNWLRYTSLAVVVLGYIIVLLIAKAEKK